MKNEDLREAISKAGLKHWQVAEAVGIHEGNFSRLLRKELSIEKKKEIHNIIDNLKNDPKGEV
ncbi:hypothetical protein [Pseudalkalibacillus salsuginis]|uniref:hypothetical protein n=1 Tax=Pseudalkalibacillus salsuginis TaxID=2910972 RepID=UPI001F3F35BC|nr:hypothetical protein [Pseudalkalibacillus salsuginis]MCF6409011.1 hypothetical protein [Pseudalkalibacillus salsuginis]